ncbi:amino acid transporter AVT6C-like [Telopea speciosissima]|uniref:amino acid transporter AVT6C-like n=1 Tax=Telopea speciosissima TaxID=54955 RepID=UPI001CC39B6C|nr:amino acid transporter AVT6C-like [Telopea speciosissima]
MRDPKMKKQEKIEADIHESLLPELRPPLESKSTDTDGGASVSGAVFNVSTSIIGAGIMSIPATLKVLGVVPAFAMIVIIAILSEVSVDFLLKYTNAGNSTTYAGVMREAFGRIGSLALQICVMLTNMGSLIIFLIIIGDVLSGSQSEGSIHLGVLQEWFGFHWWNTRAFALLFTTLFVFLPLVLLRRVESLRFTSAISVLLAVVFVGISSVMAILALCEGKTQSPRLLPDLAHQASFFELFTAAPVIVTAFTFHFNVHPIAVELQNPSKMVSAARISIVLCATIYLTVGFFGYLLFGDSTMPDILSNFDRNSDSPIGSILNDTVRLSYALHLMLVFPLVNFSLRANIHELLFTKSPQSTSADTTRFVFLTSFLLVFIYIAAIALPNIWYFFQFMGSTSAVSLALIFPGAIVLRDVHGISTRRETILAALMIILALITSSIAISSNIISLTRKL